MVFVSEVRALSSRQAFCFLDKMVSLAARGRGVLRSSQLGGVPVPMAGHIQRGEPVKFTLQLSPEAPSVVPSPPSPRTAPPSPDSPPPALTGHLCTKPQQTLLPHSPLTICLYSCVTMGGPAMCRNDWASRYRRLLQTTGHGMWPFRPRETRTGSLPGSRDRMWSLTGASMTLLRAPLVLPRGGHRVEL